MNGTPSGERAKDETVALEKKVKRGARDAQSKRRQSGFVSGS